MKRTLARIRIAPFLSLLVLATIITLWARCQRHADLVAFYGPAGTLQGIGSNPKGLLLFFSDLPFGRESRFSANAASVSAGEFASVHEWLFDPTREQWRHLGCRCASGTINLNGIVTCKYTSLIIPYWLPAILASILPVAFVRRRWTRWRRLRTGRCLQCGYDIRYSPERCPECGTSRSTEAPSEKSSTTRKVLAAAPWVFAGVAMAAIVCLFVRGQRAASAGLEMDPRSSASRGGDEVATDPQTVRLYSVGDIVDGWMASTRATHFNRNAALAGPMLSDEDRLVQILTENVTPADWIKRGGSAQMVAVVGRLAVYHTQRGHAAVRAILTALRNGGPEGGPAATSAETPNAHANFEKNFDELVIDSTFEEAIDSLRERTHANILVYWSDLQAAGVARNAKIKFHLWDITLQKALEVVCALAPTDNNDVIACEVDDNIIRIAPKEKLRREGIVVTRLYDVRDLIDELTAYGKRAGPADDRLQATMAHTTSVRTVDEAAEGLVRVIEENAAVDSWRDNGGSEGFIREIGGRLVITQTAGNHREVIRVLRVLRSGGGKEGAPLDTRSDVRPEQPDGQRMILSR